MDLAPLRASGGIMPDPNPAEQCYFEALAIAREQGARSLELRAATRLAARIIGSERAGRILQNATETVATVAKDQNFTEAA
jgi:hypothetical protein